MAQLQAKESLMLLKKGPYLGDTCKFRHIGARHKVSQKADTFCKLSSSVSPAACLAVVILEVAA